MTEHNQTLIVAVDRANQAGLESASCTEPHDRRQNSIPLSAALGLLWLQSVSFLIFTGWGVDMPMYLSYHLGLCAVVATFGVWWVRVSSAAEDANDKSAIVLQLVAWTTLAGPFGTLIATALLVPRSVGTWHADSLTGPPIELSRLELLYSSLLDRRLRVEHAHATRPLLDVIIEGTQIEKLDALSLVSKRYAPALAPTLRRALGDKDSSVRVLAATVMAQQHNAYTKRIGMLHAVAKSAPESSKHWSELGQAHLDYVGSGLLEASQAGTEVGRARAHLTRAVELDPSDAVTQARINALGLPFAYRGKPTVGARELRRNDDMPGRTACCLQPTSA
jgi:hypothetical protein